MAHADNCILAQHCTLAGGDKCNAICPSYVACHGADGLGGRIGAAGVPAEYKRLTLANSPARETQIEAYKIAEAYVGTFMRQFDTALNPRTERIKSLYLFSHEPGTGKTTTAAALLNEWVIRHYIGSLQRNGQPLERPAYFLDVNDWQKLYTTFTRPHVPTDVAEPAARLYYRQMQSARTAPFVVLDDIGVRDASDGFRGDLHSVINHRNTNGLPSVYTSNVTFEDQVRVFDGRMADRMRDMCGVVPFVGESKRGKRN
ncbi:DNA replication protein DnaC [Fontibacillus phaseoli]|uniref:DNA replication protein DnaC n=1 Tax=Fontibacillus phaseoli TaxID=1416533 RepID=A0A369BTF7_9BACL|nr:DNA replication protein [Fontibacillus phaseoli]RCX22894.1 DNA replication protein DnaC [Fontibacillus phaseoli]